MTYISSEGNKNTPSLAIVTPCYNESDAFPRCHSTLIEILNDLISQNKISTDSYVLFIDDGSKDNTWELIKNKALHDIHTKGIKLSGNFGHQKALMAGLSFIETDISISIDADLQDDTNCIYEMIDKYHQGNDVVYGVRDDRSSDSFFKRNTAAFFYKFMSAMGVNQVENHADYRLLSQRALKSLLEFKEQNIYIRGIIPLIGFSSEKVFYRRDERLEGTSKYPLKKMISLAIDGITSLTVTPLRIISLLGFFIFIISFTLGIYAIIQKINGNVVEGWSSVMTSIFFLGGIQILCLGVIGEYIGKIYMETKGRPKFIIECTSDDQAK